MNKKYKLLRSAFFRLSPAGAEKRKKCNWFNDEGMEISLARIICLEYSFELWISMKYEREQISEHYFVKLEGIFSYVQYTFSIQFM